MARGVEKLQVNVCCCIPLQLGLRLFAIFVLVHSILGIVGLVTEDYRIAVGGFSYKLSIAVSVVGVIGVLCSLACLMGIHDNQSFWVRIFGHFSAIRIVALAIFLWLDVYQFEDCGKFVGQHARYSSINSDYYNQAMHTIALTNKCAVYLLLSQLGWKTNARC
eukprot:gnl/TRDRNA2_/TRDRNA2_38139_c0_seq2.p1 gnl/TRDRNA2_/TRDRNA2_38139_c0~~gnl/TRDRNA2_/TRDRNA2_38139_c0_seq2.p1  ORF type:complete len:163 (+),score=22.54 gnl/TRDRNA2_/TRDRNA2_38139_c0_seq2:113-601(+)